MSKPFIAILLSLFFCLLISIPSYAKYRQVCEARYQTENGWSKKYTVEVTFMSGYELNDATRTFRYSTLAVYAIIFWDKGQATVIKLSTILSCSTEVDKTCIKNSYLDLKGKDQDDDQWKICAGDYCF